MKNKTNLFYIILMILMTISGFGQMPIFKRYYVADLPGLGWTANFIITHYLHYFGAILLISLFSYQITLFFITKEKISNLSFASLIKIFILIFLLGSGFLKIIINLKGGVAPAPFIFSLDLIHTGFTFLFIFYALFTKISLKKNY